MAKDGFEPVEMSEIPMEDLRDVLHVAFKALGISLEKSEGFWGTEYRAAPTQKQPEG